MKHKVIKYLLIALAAAALGFPIEYLLMGEAVEDVIKDEGFTVSKE